MIEFFLAPYKDKLLIDIFIEIIVFFFGIISVVYAKKENILVFPTGLIATVLTVYLLYKVGYFADMTINIYFSIMSIYGWINWSKTKNNVAVHQISRTNIQQKLLGMLMFLTTVLFMYGIYRLFDQPILKENYIDMLTSGLFFTAMWFMALKKIENWTLWIIGDLISIPLYGYRGLGILSLQFVIFTILAISAYKEWNAILKNKFKINE
ncbi:nicotinamide riboside transporter PnuC [Flavobacterium sp.]|uniref:nicotinamide riboside transporter PnuC n=1 Tax=Flavobacterium sp. TaxID=239 RepID=UPI00261FEF16|nr:nicotinamide riboside transporter PnuC [Flavobacterium sp.]MDD3003320.1 nicotinamide riboside transporter PnuC [Flavobacterium sp.]